MVDCPICGEPVKQSNINRHIDSNCTTFLEQSNPPPTPSSQQNGSAEKPVQVASFFKSTATRNKPLVSVQKSNGALSSNPTISNGVKPNSTLTANSKRRSEETKHENGTTLEHENHVEAPAETAPPPTKRVKHANIPKNAPLAERMRPHTLDEVCGQDLVGPEGVLRGLIETDRVPSMILWGGPGTGKTTIARVIANMVGSRFVEINSTSSGVGECKKLFAEAKGELGLTGRKTIIFCDEIHRFSKSQQDVFLAPVECGQVTLIGATTENPSFKIQNALLSRCRTFTLAKLTDDDITSILRRALDAEKATYTPSSLVDEDLLKYLASFSCGDARTALNLLELAMDLSRRPSTTKETIKSSLTKTLVYDRAGDQHYDSISAFHKSIRGSCPDAALYYLARMLQSGEDPLYIARRMVVIASEDIGLADNSMLSLATAAYTAAEKIGMPECRINLAHATVALAMSKKSTRAYRGLGNATADLQEPGVASLPIPVHLRNAPTRLMKELGYGAEYKYNPHYLDGKVAQEYLPEELREKRYLEAEDLGIKIDPDYCE
ncbi:hypothetical protein MMC09_003663 [Bachmanniomyces sp. S44760]|nr:hypothetical protein [Bachmanniomyces sp. S44760]